MHKYRLIAKKGEGTFSEVLKAQAIKSGKMVAIKCMKSHFESEEQVNNLREIQALRRLSPHANIIKLLEVLYDQPTGRLALVFELMDMNIYELIRGRRQYLPEGRIKMFMYQLVRSMDHMHRNGIFHRDIKPENILITDEQLKLADFGSCRGIYSKQPYTEYISTRWYRAPECLLTDGYYNYKMDMWGVGCVFFEIVSLYPLFPGKNEADQIQKIHNILGTPNPAILERFKRHATHIEFNFPHEEGSGIAKLIPHASPDCVELIIKLLEYNPEDRLSARAALRHPYFRDMRDAEKRSKRTSPRESPLEGGSRQGAGSSKNSHGIRSQVSSTKPSMFARSAVNSIKSNEDDNDHGSSSGVAAAAAAASSKKKHTHSLSLGAGLPHIRKGEQQSHGSEHSMPSINHHYSSSHHDPHHLDVSGGAFPDIRGGNARAAGQQQDNKSFRPSYNKYNTKKHNQYHRWKKDSSRLADAYSGASSNYGQHARRLGLGPAGSKVIPPLGSVRRQ
jgi:renal tumor antigen